ncbi:MAG TPA: tail fiber protein [Polyangia bacterium]
MAVAGVFPSPSGSTGDNFLDEVRLFAGNFVPGGWVLTDGTLLPINTNTAVFSLTGTQYGGNGVSNFALPDLRGRAAIHRGQGPGLTLRTIGQTIGTEAEPLTISQMGLHTHSVPVSGAAAPALSTLGCVALTAVLLAIGLARLRQSDSRA